MLDETDHVSATLVRLMMDLPWVDPGGRHEAVERLLQANTSAPASALRLERCSRLLCGMSLRCYAATCAALYSVVFDADDDDEELLEGLYRNEDRGVLDDESAEYLHRAEELLRQTREALEAPAILVPELGLMRAQDVDDALRVLVATQAAQRSAIEAYRYALLLFRRENRLLGPAECTQLSRKDAQLLSMARYATRAARRCHRLLLGYARRCGVEPDDAKGGVERDSTMATVCEELSALVLLHVQPPGASPLRSVS